MRGILQDNSSSFFASNLHASRESFDVGTRRALEILVQVPLEFSRWRFPTWQGHVYQPAPDLSTSFLPAPLIFSALFVLAGLVSDELHKARTLGA